jgi:two-component system response regulator DevR
MRGRPVALKSGRNGQTGSMASQCRIIIADELELFRRGLRSLLEAEGYNVAGDVETAQAAVALSNATSNAILLIDAGLAGIDSVEVLLRVNGSSDTKSVVLAASFEEKRVIRSICAGAHGYVAKDCEPSQLFSAIDLVCSGGLAFSDAVAGNLRSGIATLEGAIVERDRERIGMTKREFEILQLLPSSRNLTQIAGELYVSRKTVQNNVSLLYRKLGTTTRHGAIAKAAELRLIDASRRR